MRTIKNLGIATAVALALIAVAGASAASASKFESPGAGPGETTTWSGARLGANHKLRLGEDWFSCSGVSFSGQMIGLEATELTISPELGCTWFAHSAGWVKNGCEFRFHPGDGSGNQTTGSVDIVDCGKPMSFDFETCHLEFGNQNGIGTVVYENAEVGGVRTVTMKANLEGITYTRRGAGCDGINGTYHDGTYFGEWTVKGARAGVQPGIQVNNGFPPPAPTKFATQEAPATITSQSGGKFLTFPQAGQYAYCTVESSNESSTTTLASLTVAPTLSKCLIDGLYEYMGASASMGGCSFKYNVSGGFEILGATCASSPITVTVTYPGEECTITVGPQGPFSGLGFVNEGTGRSRLVKITTAPVVGLKYTAAGPYCAATGTFSDGLYKAKVNIKATNAEGATQGIWVE